MGEQTAKINNWVLGLTGGIGCGKTAVSNMFEELAITVVDADIIAREVVEPNSEGLNAIIAHFGKDILLPDGTLNRAALRTKIFTNHENKKWLNALLHPLIRKKILADLNNATSPYVVLVAPLLFENNLDRYCNHTLLIDVPTSVQIERTAKRDNTTIEQVKSIITAQMSREDKQQKADDILNNDRDLKLVHAELVVLHKNYLHYALNSKTKSH
ncbi:Dephospho-CoA kinase [Pseudoalteromonas carrageenovora]|uniref:Dephospho-CoA kinase n=1 Tax=Pseudoalteromonas carrageenovora IAM 12662 TaxID=1314868 RepID=A0A2K4XCP9_PSEVC|nr:dephospho-CoA kinase [Pseudoalteromonas carrageenovora]MBE0380969.1 dephospho-CoA kinase [Pseudoalteromonas carrageenovora IAM 12662]QBJ72985.1 Dephospho-CoA kinase [Pseudoalteromonas carrageenovora]GEB72712.1 dephospho-CoA kinase [Pseudoalteromonas carrageenovora]SOU42103.1 dephospho-CoA kinase [Pseudoalteromonas carrageenovora IAM 12662]